MTTDSARPRTIWPPVALPTPDVLPQPADATTSPGERREELPPITGTPQSGLVTSGLRPPTALAIDDDTADRVIKAANTRLPRQVSDRTHDLADSPLIDAAGGVILNAAMIPGWPPPLPMAQPVIKSPDVRTAPAARAVSSSDLSQDMGTFAGQPLAQRLQREAGMLLAILTYAAGLARAAFVVARELRGMGLERRQLLGTAETDASRKRRRFWLR